MGQGSSKSQQSFSLDPIDNERLATLCGQLDENISLLERHLGVEINNRGHQFHVIGIPTSVQKTCKLLKKLYQDTKTQPHLDNAYIMLVVNSMTSQTQEHSTDKPVNLEHGDAQITVNNNTIKARTPNQYHYLRALQQFDINFGIGPSGTGKTFLAVAQALADLQNETVGRIVLTRPAVEAGENLGFLPGDLSQKIDPYLRPLYDALYEMFGVSRINQLIQKGTIEIAPLAYMRGRTLNDSFIILDEGQNTTPEQMKMFLTRLGFKSKAVITGDITQTDLPKKNQSGLRHAIRLLQDIDTLHFTFFKPNDVVRHQLVQQIIEAYEKHDTD